MKPKRKIAGRPRIGMYVGFTLTEKQLHWIDRRAGKVRSRAAVLRAIVDEAMTNA